VLVDDGNGEDDPLHLVVEVKGYRRRRQDKKNTWRPTGCPG
jgi:type III restriction enzyme